MRDIKPSAERLENFLRENILPIEGVVKIYWGENLWESATIGRWCLTNRSPSIRIIERKIVIFVADGAGWPIKEAVEKLTNNTGLILGRPYEVWESDIPNSRIL